MALQPTNRLLSSLSPEGRARLLHVSVPVNLPIRTPLYSPDKPPTHAYFMTSGMASVVASMEDGATAEIGIIGQEGVVGAIHLLGPAKNPTNCFIQMEGTGLKIPFGELSKAFHTSEEIRARLLEYFQVQALTVSQISGCNRLHEAEQRLARWLLMAQDCSQREVMFITQEFLGQMLGSRRTTVTLIAINLQRQGLIDYTRGRVKILNREGLENAACECYRVTKSLLNHLYTQPLRQ